MFHTNRWFLIALVFVFGCNRQEEYEVSGFVCTSENLAQSYIGPGLRDQDVRCKAIPDAEIYLSTSSDSKDALPNGFVTSDGSGHYTIAGINHKGPIYIITEKAGYDSLRYRISIGTLSGFMKNTIELKPK